MNSNKRKKEWGRRVSWKKYFERRILKGLDIRGDGKRGISTNHCHVIVFREFLEKELYNFYHDDRLYIDAKGDNEGFQFYENNEEHQGILKKAFETWLEWYDMMNIMKDYMLAPSYQGNLHLDDKATLEKFIVHCSRASRCVAEHPQTFGSSDLYEKIDEELFEALQKEKEIDVKKYIQENHPDLFKYIWESQTITERLEHFKTFIQQKYSRMKCDEGTLSFPLFDRYVFEEYCLDYMWAIAIKKKKRHETDKK